MPTRQTPTRQTPSSQTPSSQTPTTGADRTKVLSVRLTVEEFEALTARATDVGVGPSTLARTFVRQALTSLSATPSPPPAAASARVSQLEEHLEALLAAGLVARVEALEGWVAGH